MILVSHTHLTQYNLRSINTIFLYVELTSVSGLVHFEGGCFQPLAVDAL